MRMVIDIHKYYIQYILGDKACLDKAYSAAKDISRKHPAHTGLYLYTALLEIEKGNTSVAEDILASFKPYANFYKGGESYAFYNFLLGLLDSSVAEKSKDAILAFKKDYSQYICYMYIDNEPSIAYTYLDKAFTAGCRSPFLYLCFYKIFKKGRRYYKSALLLAFLKWANAHNLLTAEMLQANERLITEEIWDNIFLFMEIYEKVDNDTSDWLLLEICKVLLSKGDYSSMAYEFYNKLSAKQIYEQEFNNALIYSAYINKKEDICRFSVENFMNRATPVPIDIRPFVFHILLTLPHLRDLVDTYNMSEDIVALALHGASTDISSKDQRYYNTLFRYTLENNKDKSKISGKAVNVMESSIASSLFLHKLTTTNPKVAHVWISEQTRAEPTSYQLDWSSGRGEALVRITSKHFRILCLDQSKKSIIDEEPKLQEQVQEDFWLYNYLYKKGHTGTGLLTAIADHYIHEGAQTEECTIILRRAMKTAGLSNHFRMQIAQTLGNVLFKLNHIERALEYYKEIDPGNLEPRHIETMFKVFMANNEYQQVIKLIQGNSRNITETVLCESIETLLQAQENPKKYKPIFKVDIRPLISGTIYELLIKGYYSETFLKTVLDYYKGSIHEWCKLSDVLNEHQISNSRLDEKVLNAAIYMRHISLDVLQVFLRAYSSSHLQNSNVVDDFVYYLCYKTIVEEIDLPQNVIDVLKEIYGKKEDIVLIIALAILAINSKEEEGEKILKEAMKNLELSNMFLPIFMERAREHLTDMQQGLYCISYTADAGKKIYIHTNIHTKTGGEKKYTKTQMNYFKFGIYTTSFPIFYNEKVSYYFEDKEKKSETMLYKNERVDLKPLDDNFELNPANEFFAINNALIYFEMFKHDEMEKLLYGMYRPKEAVKFKLL
ncbi:MAG: DUF5717 family protein [Defluviitaleaceae bacterium]|nr:DUF5717 family protein [Defluviitaleaceae bacterium]